MLSRMGQRFVPKAALPDDQTANRDEFPGTRLI